LFILNFDIAVIFCYKIFNEDRKFYRAQVYYSEQEKQGDSLFLRRRMRGDCQRDSFFYSGGVDNERIHSGKDADSV